MNLSINVTDIKGLAPGKSVILTDKLTGEIYDLTPETNIQFTASAGLDQNRFVLSYGYAEVLAVDESLTQPIFKFLNDELSVSFNKLTSIQGFSIHDLSGKLLLENENRIESNQLVIPFKYEGVNIIRIHTGEGIFTRKFRVQ